MVIRGMNQCLFGVLSFWRQTVWCSVSPVVLNDEMSQHCEWSKSILTDSHFNSWGLGLLTHIDGCEWMMPTGGSKWWIGIDVLQRECLFWVYITAHRVECTCTHTWRAEWWVSCNVVALSERFGGIGTLLKGTSGSSQDGISPTTKPLSTLGPNGTLFRDPPTPRPRPYRLSYYCPITSHL